MAHNTMLDAALEYLDQGFSVIPVKRSDKRPYVKWEEFQHRLPPEVYTPESRQQVYWRTMEHAEAGHSSFMGSRDLPRHMHFPFRYCPSLDQNRLLTRLTYCYERHPFINHQFRKTG